MPKSSAAVRSEDCSFTGLENRKSNRCKPDAGGDAKIPPAHSHFSDEHSEHLGLLKSNTCENCGQELVRKQIKESYLESPHSESSVFTVRNGSSTVSNNKALKMLSDRTSWRCFHYESTDISKAKVIFLQLRASQKI